jgi:hypothetical protein
MTLSVLRRTIFCTLALTTLAGLATTQSPVARPADLIGWYEPFGYVGQTQDPRAVKMIPVGADGYSVAGVGVGPGMVGTAYTFATNNACVVLPDLGLFSPFEFTIEAWVYWDPVGATRNYILAQGDVFANQGWALMSNDLGHWHWHFDSSPQFPPSPGLTLPVKQWTHIAVTYDGSKLRFYQNEAGQPFTGPLVKTPTKSPGSANGPILMGNSFAGGTPFDGTLDELAFYSRALADAEIQAIFEAGAAGKLKPQPTLPFLFCWIFHGWAPVLVGAWSDHATEMTWSYQSTKAGSQLVSVNGYPNQNLGILPGNQFYSLYLISRNDHWSSLSLGCLFVTPFFPSRVAFPWGAALGP